MVNYHGFDARVGAAAVALAVGAGVVSGQGCGLAAAGLDSGAMALPAGDSQLFVDVVLLALSYADYYNDPWVEAETAMERGVGSMYINQYFSLSPANIAGYDYNATITQQPVFPSVVTGDYGQSDAYLVAWSPIGSNADITGVWKMDVGVPIAEQIGYGHDVVFFDRGFYPQIFSQIPGFTPELGDHAFPGNPTDPGDPGGPTDPDSIPDVLKDIWRALAPYMTPAELETLLANLAMHPLTQSGLDELLQSLTSYDGDLGKYAFDNVSSLIDIASQTVKGLGAYAKFIAPEGSALAELGLKASAIGYAAAVALQVDKDTIGMILENRQDFTPQNMWLVVQNDFEHPDQAVAGLWDGIESASKSIGDGILALIPGL